MNGKDRFEYSAKIKYKKNEYAEIFHTRLISILLFFLLILSAVSCLAEVGKLCMPGVCFQNKAQRDAWEKENNCVFRSHANEPAIDCSEKLRADQNFLRKQEGKLLLNGYIPKYKKDTKDSKGVLHKAGEVIGVSGVTISTGIDLGQQNNVGTRRILNNYIALFGNSTNVDVNALIKKLDPYFTFKQDTAVEVQKEHEKDPLKVTENEADLLEKAFGYATQVAVSKQFDLNNSEQMIFKKLPAETQTAIIDFAYQYGLNEEGPGPERPAFWGYVYKGDWAGLSAWLLSGPDIFTDRRKDEGGLLKAAIDAGKLPASGDPCKGIYITPPSIEGGKETPIFDSPLI